MYDIVKGTRIRAEVFKVKPLGTYSIAGVQAKVIGDFITVVGKVTHIYGDHPTAPTKYEIYVQPDDGGPEVVIGESCIREILPAVG